MRLVQLTGILRLGTGNIEQRAEEAGEGRLRAMVDNDVGVEPVFVAQHLIDAARDQPFVREVAGSAVVGDSLWISSHRGRIGRSRRRIPEAVHALIERNRGRVAVRDNIATLEIRQVVWIRRICDDRAGAEALALELGAWRIHGAANRNDDPQTFGIEEEEGLVFLDRSADGAGPLVGVVEGARGLLPGGGVLVEPVVGVHDAAVPPVGGVAVETVRAAAADLSRLRAAKASE